MKTRMRFFLLYIASLTEAVENISTDYAIIVEADDKVTCTFSSLGEILWASETSSSATFTDVKQQKMTLTDDKFWNQP